MTRVLLLIPTASYRAPDFMEAAAKLGLEVVVGSERGQPLAELFPGRTLTAPLDDVEAGAGAIVRFADAFPLDAIVAVDDRGTVVAAEAAERLRLPHNPVAAMRAARDKSLMRARLDEAGLPGPWWRLASFGEDREALAGTVPYPCVIKPVALSGSTGVMRADDAEDFAAKVERLRAILSAPEVAAECGDYAESFLVEGYVPGVEVSLEGLMREGRLHTLALFDKPDPLEGPFFEETIYVTPSRLTAARQGEVATVAERAARALGIAEGPVHAELRLNETGVYPIDIAARSIGGLCARTLSFGTGMSLEEILLRHATGAPLETLEREEAASGVMMIPIPAAGTLRGVGGLEAARRVPGVREVSLTLRVGDRLTPLPEGREYLGFIFARGATAAEVESALRGAHGRLSFEVEAEASGGP